MNIFILRQKVDWASLNVFGTLGFFKTVEEVMNDILVVVYVPGDCHINMGSSFSHSTFKVRHRTFYNLILAKRLRSDEHITLKPLSRQLPHFIAIYPGLFVAVMLLQ